MRFKFRPAITTLFGLAVMAVCPAVVINEFVASNASTLADEDGDYSDWIELYNGGLAAVELAGFGLTDNSDRPFKWTFPAVTLEPSGYLLVWASGKDRREPDRPLHANFAISAAGEPLLLSLPSGEVVDSVGPVELLRDQGYARIPDGGEWGFTGTVTPLAANSGTVGEPLEPPVFSLPSGFYPLPMDIALEHADSQVTILYTLDGSEPDVSALDGSIYVYKTAYPAQPGDPVGPLLRNFPRTFAYNGQEIAIHAPANPPLWQRNTTNAMDAGSYLPDNPPYAGRVIRARAIKPGRAPSRVVSQVFFPAYPPHGLLGELPLISIVLPSQSLFDYYTGIYTAGYFFDWWRSVNPDEPTFLWSGFGNYYLTGSATQKAADLEWFSAAGEPVFARSIGLRLHGGTSRSFAQKSLRLYSGAQYDSQGEFTGLLFPDLVGRGSGLPVTAFRNLILRNSGTDAFDTRIRDALAQLILEPLGLDQQAWQPVYHFINGEFWGLINLRERIDRFMLAQHHLLDPDAVAMVEITPEGVELGEGEPTDLDDFLQLLAWVETADLSDPQQMAELERHLDVENLLLYHMAQVFIKNTDWPGNNVRLWRARSAPSQSRLPTHDGRWRYIVFDLDFALAPAWGLGNDHNTLAFALDAQQKEWPNPAWSTLLLRKLVHNDEFRDRFVQAFADHMNSTFHPRRIVPLIDAVDTFLASPRRLHATRWRDFQNLPATVFRDFFAVRESFIGHYLEDYFELSGRRKVQLELSTAAGGEIRINTLRLNAATPALADPRQPFPWSGYYFSGAELPIEVFAYPGFEWAGWQDLDGNRFADNRFHLDADLSITALFRRAALRLMHYWSFNAADQPLDSSYSEYAGMRIGWLPQFGGQIRLERDPSFSDAVGLFHEGAGLQLAVTTAGGSMLVIPAAATGYVPQRLSYLARRSADAPLFHWIEFSTDGLRFETLELVSVPVGAPMPVELDLSAIRLAADNPDFTLRIRFVSGGGLSGGQHYLDGVAVLGIPILSAAASFAEQGIMWEGSVYETAALGSVHAGFAEQGWLYQPESGWIYILQANMPGEYWVFKGSENEWAWVPDGQLPYHYSYKSRRWVLPP